MDKINQIKKRVLDILLPEGEFVRVDAVPSPLPPSALRNIEAYAQSVDPLSGRNVMRRAAQLFKDNGDGTMAMRRQPPYVKRQG